MIQLKRTIARAVAGVATVAACGTFAITAPNLALGQDTSANTVTTPTTPSQGIDTSEGLELGSGARVTSTVSINQVGVKEEALAAVKKWRQDALDTNVRWVVNGEEKTVADALTTMGISREEYLNPKWSYAMERLAIQRIAEVLSYELGHTRPNGGSPWTVSYNGVQSGSEILSWGDSTVAQAINHWATEKADWVGKTGGVTGHYTTLIDPKYSSYGFAGANQWRWAGEATTRSDNDNPTNWSGDLTFTLPMEASHFQNAELQTPVSLSVGQTHAIAMSEVYSGGQYDNDTNLRYILSLKSSDTNIVSVDGDKIVGIKPGTATITVASGDQTRDITVNVVAAKITSVSNPTGITVNSGTTVADLGLPTTVRAMFDNNTSDDVPVSWNELTAEQQQTLKARKGGSFTLSGTVVGWDKPLQITVTVSPATVVSADISNADKQVQTPSGTAPALAKQGQVVWSNGDTEMADVQWNAIEKSQYTKRDGGTFTVQGKLAGKTVAATVTVLPAKVSNIAPIAPVTTEAKTAPKLPETAKVTWSNGDTSDEQITWNITNADYAKRGENQISGTILTGTKHEQTVTTTLTVTAGIVKVNNPEAVTTPSGTNPKDQLPKQVTVTYADDESEQVAVTWADSSKDQYTQTKGGSYQLTGTVAGTTLPATITVHVTPATLETVDNPTAITVASGTKEADLQLPKTVVAHYSDGTAATVPVKWNALTDEQKEALAAKDEGSFALSGTAENKNVTLTIKVIAATITGIVSPDDITVDSGTTADRLQLPATVTVHWSNGSTSEAAVQWNALTDEQQATLNSIKGGSFTLSGDVAGYTKPQPRLLMRLFAAVTGAATSTDDVTITVHVTPATVRSIAPLPDVSTDSGVAPKLPETASVTWSNGQTTNESITWNKLDTALYSTRNASTFEVDGTAAGSPVKVTVKVHAAAIVSVVPQTQTVETIAGTAPTALPSATVTWSNGDTESVMPSWDAISDNAVAQAGEFTEQGTVTVDSQTFNVSVKVVVKAKEEPKPEPEQKPDSKPTDNQQAGKNSSTNQQSTPAKSATQSKPSTTLAATGAAIAAIVVLAVLALAVGIALRVRSAKSTAATQSQHTEEQFTVAKQFALVQQYKVKKH